MKSRRRRSFRRDFQHLPVDVQVQARAAYHLFMHDPFHSSLDFKRVGRRSNVWSIRIGLSFRAVGIRRTAQPEDTIVWFWIGSHADYDELLRRV
jgi:hypothetical protein